MFGCICSGRAVQTNLEIVSESQAAFTLPSAQTINHIVLFLLPDTVLPLNCAATVHFSWPGRPFQLLGGLSNNKPSAIFRLKDNHEVTTEDVTAQLGIAIQPIAEVEAQLSTLPAHLASLHNAAPASTSTALVAVNRKRGESSGGRIETVTLARRIIKHAFNFMQSFSQGPPGQEVVPMKAFQEWWSKFENKMTLDAGFLERDDE